MPNLLPSSNNKTNLDVFPKQSFIPKNNILQRTIVNQNQFFDEEIKKVKVTVIDINKVVNDRFKTSRKRIKVKNFLSKREEQKEKESRIEKRQNKPLDFKKSKVPEMPKTGFLDGVKNYLGNILMGLFFTRIDEFMPQIITTINIIKPVVGFIADVASKLLNGLVTFIDWGYKAYDQTRKWVGEKFGDDAIKKFDQFTKAFDAFITGAVTLGIIYSQGKGPGMKPPAKTPQPKPTPSWKSGIRGYETWAKNFPQQAAADSAKQAARQSAATAPKGFRFTPGSLGSGLASAGIGAILSYLMDWGFSFVDAQIVANKIQKINSLPPNKRKKAIQQITSDLQKESKWQSGFGGTFDKVIALGGETPSEKKSRFLYNLLSGINQQPIETKAIGGQVTRGGQQVGGAITRTVQKPQKRKIIQPVKTKPAKTRPGLSIGGPKKIEHVFPNPTDRSVANPFQVLMKASASFKDRVPILGEAMGVAVDAVLGQKPSPMTMQKYGKNLGLFVQNAINAQTNSTMSDLFSSIQKMADGGMVQDRSKQVKKYSDNIGNMITAFLTNSINAEINKIISDLQRQLKLRATASAGGGPGPGGGNEIPTPGARLRGGSNAQIEADLLEYFTALYGKNAAVGIVANLQRESGYRTKTPDNSRYEGMAQWSRDDRWPKFVKWTEKNKLDPYNRNAQAQYIAIELKQLGTDKRISQAKTPEEAASIFYNEFERGAYSKPVKGTSYNPDNPHENKNRGFVQDLTKRNPEIGKRAGEVLAPLSFDATLKASTFKGISGTSGESQGNVPLNVPYSPFTSSAGNPTITSGRGIRSGREHRGLDIGAAEGTPMFAYLPGVIVSSGWDSGGYGYRVAWKDANGNIHSYSHMQSDPGFRVGQQVTQGQLMGKVGNTGRSTAPHLHWEIVSGGTYHDPVKWTQRNPLPSPIQLAMKNGKEGVMQNGQWTEQSWTDEQRKRYQQQQSKQTQPTLNKGVYYDPSKKKFFKKGGGFLGLDQEVNVNEGSNMQFRSLPNFLGRGTHKNQIKKGPDGQMYYWDGNYWQKLKDPEQLMSSQTQGIPSQQIAMSTSPKTQFSSPQGDALGIQDYTSYAPMGGTKIHYLIQPIIENQPVVA